MTRPQLFDQPSFIKPFDDTKALQGKSVGVTGARGVLGRVLVDRLTPLDISLSAFEGDIRNKHEVDGWTRAQAFDLIFHLAAVVPVEAVLTQPLRALETNALGPTHVATSGLAANPRSWIFSASSSHVYTPSPASSPVAITEDSATEPPTFYGVTKLLGEQVLRPLAGQLGYAVCIGRIFSFSHATQEHPYLVPSLRGRIAQLTDGEVLRVKNTTAVRDILDAETVVDCMLHLAARRQAGMINIGSGRGTTVLRIAQQLAERLGKCVHIASAGEATADALVADVGRLRAALDLPIGS